MPITIGDFTAQTLPKLSKLSNPLLELCTLYRFVCAQTKEYFFAHPEALLSNSEAKHLETLISLRLQGQPLAYLVQKKEFYSHSFIVNDTVLIPRQETELLVDLALEKITHLYKSNATVYNNATTNIEKKPPINILDCGTGSGCIGISILAELLRTVLDAVSTYNFYLSDISAEALALAKDNATLILEPIKKELSGNAISLDSKLNFLQGNLLSFEEKINFDIIIANLPYVPEFQYNIANLISEPSLALTGNTQDVACNKYIDTGIVFIEKLLAQASAFTHPHTILLELDPSQIDEVSFLMSQYHYTHQEIHYDLRSIARVMLARRY